MAVNNHLFLQTFCPCGTDIILRQGVDHCRADGTGHTCQTNKDQYQYWQCHIIHSISKFGKSSVGGAGSLGTAYREYLQLNGKQVDEYNTDQITGQAIPYYCYRLDRTIGSLPAMNSAINTQRNGNGEGKYGTEQVQQYGVCHWRFYDINDRTLIQSGIAKLPL